MTKFTIFLATIFLLASCSIDKPLHQSGAYVIESRDGNLARLQGVRGTYEFISDTLKVGDTIQVTMMRRKN